MIKNTVTSDLGIVYQSCTDNRKKFDLLQQKIDHNYLFSLEEYQLIFSDDIEVAFFFIDEYHFKDAKEDKAKFDLCRKFILAAIKEVDRVDSLKLEDLLDLAKKISYWKIGEDYIFNLFLWEYKFNMAITYLDFLLDHLNHFPPVLLISFLEKHKAATGSVLTNYLVLLALYIINGKLYQKELFGFIYHHKQDTDLKKRLISTYRYYNFKGMKPLVTAILEIFLLDKIPNSGAESGQTAG